MSQGLSTPITEVASASEPGDEGSGETHDGETDIVSESLRSKRIVLAGGSPLIDSSKSVSWKLTSRSNTGRSSKLLANSVVSDDGEGGDVAEP